VRGALAWKREASPLYNLPLANAWGTGYKGMFAMLPPWATKPEFCIPILVSVVFFILSLYGPEIRRMIDTRPTKTRNWWKSVRLNRFRYELETLKLRHNNSYELVLYAVTEVGQMAIYAVALGVLGMLFASVKSKYLTSADFGIVIIAYFSAGCFMISASLMKCFVEFRHLKHYDERVAHLEKKIADLT
jgi:hypothetical protein